MGLRIGGTPRVVRRFGALALVIVVLGVAPLLGPAWSAGGQQRLAKAALAATCVPSWRTVPSPAELKDPRGLAPIAADDIWVVGSRVEAGVPGSVETAVARWDGNRWSLVASPNRSTGGYVENALNGGVALDQNTAWAVGYSLTKREFKTLVVRWDGVAWDVVESPNVGHEGSSLTAVAGLSPDALWAVGFYWQGAQRKTLVLRWDGRAWAIVESPNPGSISNVLLDVTVLGEDDVWAVGYQSGEKGHRALILHYDGQSWREVPVAAQGDGDNVLTAITAVSTGELWAAGYFVEGTDHRALTVRSNGNGWTAELASDDGEQIRVLRDITGRSGDNVWAVGFAFQAAENAFVPTTQHWDGTTWTAFPSRLTQTERGLSNGSEMRAVNVSPGTDQVWVAGSPANIETICLEAEGTPMIAQPRTELTPTLSANVAASSSGPNEGGSAASRPPAATKAHDVYAVDMAETVGIGESTRTYGALVADFNADGSPDIFLGRHLGAPSLYRNNGEGRFTEINEGEFELTDRHFCAAADIDQNGWLDIFCSVGALHGAGIKLNQLFLQQRDGSFVEQAAAYGVAEPFARGRGAAFVDANGDRFPDLLLMNESNRADGMPSPNRLFLNVDGVSFRSAPAYGLEVESDGGQATQGDVDDDGWADLLVIDQPHNQTLTPVRLYHNDGGIRYSDVTKAVGLGHEAVDAIFSDLDGDGLPDVAEVTRDDLRVWRNNDGVFTEVFTTPVTAGLSLGSGDVNGDGRNDLYLLRGKEGAVSNASDVVYVNNGIATEFVPMTEIPATNEGEADSVWPIDHDGNGLTDFLVLNGHGSDDGDRDTPGPVQLISFFPETNATTPVASPTTST